MLPCGNATIENLKINSYMSTANAQAAPTGELPKIDKAKIAIVGTLWNAHIVSRLAEGAVSTLVKAGFDREADIEVVSVPGAVELTFAATKLIERGGYDAVIMLGCVIRGGTPHFDYVCQSVTQGMTELNLLGEIPVIFGILTVDSENDALDRAGGALGNKGSEAAEAAIRMIAFNREVG